MSLWEQQIPIFQSSVCQWLSATPTGCVSSANRYLVFGVSQNRDLEEALVTFVSIPGFVSTKGSEARLHLQRLTLTVNLLVSRPPKSQTSGHVCVCVAVVVEAFQVKLMEVGRRALNENGTVLWG